MQDARPAHSFRRRSFARRGRQIEEIELVSNRSLQRCLREDNAVNRPGFAAGWRPRKQASQLPMGISPTACCRLCMRRGFLMCRQQARQGQDTRARERGLVYHPNTGIRGVQQLCCGASKTAMGPERTLAVGRYGHDGEERASRSAATIRPRHE
jgi:hypothetical protein